MEWFEIVSEKVMVNMRPLNSSKVGAAEWGVVEILLLGACSH